MLKIMESLFSIYKEGNFQMDNFEKDREEDQFEEPPLEDFLPNEEDERIKERQRKRRSVITKVVAIILAFALVVSALQIWPQIFNLSSISFLQKSAELSQKEDIRQYKEAVVTIKINVQKVPALIFLTRGSLLRTIM